MSRNQLCAVKIQKESDIDFLQKILYNLFIIKISSQVKGIMEVKI